jgi:hypothetical protein
VPIARADPPSAAVDSDTIQLSTISAAATIFLPHLHIEQVLFLDAVRRVHLGHALNFETTARQRQYARRDSGTTRYFVFASARHCLLERSVSWKNRVISAAIRSMASLKSFFVTWPLVPLIYSLSRPLL